MKGRNLAVIVAALRPASGTTLLARLFADYAILSREHPLIFDTDSIDRSLSRYFPRSARRVDLDRVQGQMSLFDTLASATPGTRVVDVTHRRMKKFFDLMPNLQASDFDYVIFDMPPLGLTSPTLGMAGFMDKMLLVVEGEKNNRDAVRRGYEALVASRDNVSVVFNKARSYIPKWLHSDS